MHYYLCKLILHKYRHCLDVVVEQLGESSLKLNPRQRLCAQGSPDCWGGRLYQFLMGFNFLWSTLSGVRGVAQFFVFHGQMYVLSDKDFILPSMPGPPTGSLYVSGRLATVIRTTVTLRLNYYNMLQVPQGIQGQSFLGGFWVTVIYQAAVKLCSNHIFTIHASCPD